MSDILKHAHVLGFALEHPWAVTPAMRLLIAGILAQHVAGEEPDPVALAALVDRKNLPQPSKGGAVAIIPIYGVIAPRMNMMSDMSGGTTFEALTNQLHEAMANDAVKTIVFDVNSPGGNVAGASEFAAEVLKARATKPIIAQAQHLMASAAYWAMAGATKIYASQSAMVGSIGVYTLHDDISEALKLKGIKRTVISAGKFKAEGADGGALTDEALAHITEIATVAYGRFVDDVARGRGVKVSAVRNGYGEGRAVGAVAALEAGLIDGVATLSDTLARVLTTPRAPAPSASATDQELPIAATSQEPAFDALWRNALDQEAVQAALATL